MTPSHVVQRAYELPATRSPQAETKPIKINLFIAVSPQQGALDKT
jgi:hypothetical protein